MGYFISIMALLLDIIIFIDENLEENMGMVIDDNYLIIARIFLMLKVKITGKPLALILFIIIKW